jgi:hypothetical protein
MFRNSAPITEHRQTKESAILLAVPGRRRGWSAADLERAVATSASFAQVLTQLGLRAAGGNYATIHRAIERAGLDTSHFSGQAWRKNVVLGPRRSLDAYLSNGYPISSYRLKQRLINEGVFTAKCNKCGGVEWLGQPIPLELDHRDGNSKNNNLENLELLCPNCHAQTPTYRGKNRKRA